MPLQLFARLLVVQNRFQTDVGTIRGDYVLDSYTMSDTDGRAIRNLIHASGNAAEAEGKLSTGSNQKKSLITDLFKRESCMT